MRAYKQLKNEEKIVKDSRRPTVWPLLLTIRMKYGARTWAICHLKRVGLPKTTLAKMYCCLIRQVFYHMLTTEMSERLQRMVLKIVYGFKMPYEEALKISGIQRLDEKGTDLALQFALMAEKNPGPALQDRLRKSPIHSMIINAHHDKII